MEIKKYTSIEDVRNAFNKSVAFKKSSILETNISVSFREYNGSGQTLVLHIFYK